MSMRSFFNGTLEHSELSELLGKIQSEHLRDVFESVFLEEEPDEGLDLLVHSGNLQGGQSGQTMCSNNDDGFSLLFVEGDLTLAGSLGGVAR